MERSMHTPLTLTPKGEGDHSMWRRPRRRKSSILWVVSARCVWLKLHCLNPSPTGLFDAPNGRWLQTLGPVSRVISRMDGSIHRRWQTLITREYGTNGRPGALPELISAGNAGSPKQEQSCMATEAQYYSMYGCNGRCRPRKRYRQKDKPWQHWRNPTLSGRKWASGTWKTCQGKVGCADAIPKPRDAIIQGKVRAVCAERCKHGSWEGGTCDPVMDDRPLLYRWLRFGQSCSHPSARNEASLKLQRFHFLPAFSACCCSLWLSPPG